MASFGGDVDTISDQHLTALSENSEWHALLHYEPSYLGGKQSSAVNSPEFFLSSSGSTDALAELRDTVAAMLVPVANPDLHARCRFPARLMWLQRSVRVLQRLPAIDCDTYGQWLGEKEVTSISMVFAAGHMKSPASFFGHNFLKFNYDNATGGSPLLDNTVNFGADVPVNEGGLTYFYNGIFGGYSAVYEQQPFFRHMAKYGEEDLRDVWEYELDLRPDELQLIVAHIWELQQVSLTYYFFRKNCAYQIAKLFALITPAQLVPQHMPWTMPYNVFSALMETQLNDRPLVREIYYHPSRRSRFHQRYFALSGSQRRLFAKLVATLPDTGVMSAAEPGSLLAVIDSLMDYYEFRLRLNTDDDRAREAKKAVLMKRFLLPPSQQYNSFDKPFAPHSAQRPGYIGLSVVDNHAMGNGFGLRLRPAYFDFLSLDIGRSAAGEFNVLDTSLSVKDDTVRLRALDVLNVTNLAPSVTGISGDSGVSWLFRFGYQQTNNSCLDCLRTSVEWQRGRSVKFSDTMTAYLLAGGKLQAPSAQDNLLALKARAGVVGSLAPWLKLHAFVERHEDAGSNGLDRNRARVDLRFGARHNWDLRFSYERDAVEQLSFTAGYYW